jgi:phosphopantothenoylcysteine decarboxylase
MKRRILLGLTGSVASILYAKLIERLGKLGEVEVILTEKANSFIHLPQLCDSLEKVEGVLYTDDDEWLWRNNGNGFTNKWKKDDPVLHIELRNKASALVIAPCSANTLAKITNGICDNLLTTVARAWDMNRPFIIAPAGNTHMWNHPLTKQQLATFIGFNLNNSIVEPQSKMLACGTEGIGAMADIDSIVSELKSNLQWSFPLNKDECSGIPITGHPGSFLYKRKHHIHTGIDLYTRDGAAVFSVEAGTVVGIEHFTGPQDNQPWWNDTDCILIEGASGVICYGEIVPSNSLEVGDTVSAETCIGRVKRVLKEGKERPNIMGHSTSMLHMELYPHGKYKAFEEYGDNPDSFDILQDPTPYLLDSLNRPEKELTHPMS